MKITKKIMMAALITSFLSGSVYAAYDPNDQSATKVMDLKDIGFASARKLSITRPGIDAILDPRFDPDQGCNENAKNTKAFLSGVVHGTIDRFAGADEPSKRAAFLTALDHVLATTNPLELDIWVARFNPATPIAGTDVVRDAVEIFLAAINPVPVMHGTVSVSASEVANERAHSPVMHGTVSVSASEAEVANEMIHSRLHSMPISLEDVSAQLQVMRGEMTELKTLILQLLARR